MYNLLILLSNLYIKASDSYNSEFSTSSKQNLTLNNDNGTSNSQNTRLKNNSSLINSNLSQLNEYDLPITEILGRSYNQIIEHKRNLLKLYKNRTKNKFTLDNIHGKIYKRIIDTKNVDTITEEDDEQKLTQNEFNTMYKSDQNLSTMKKNDKIIKNGKSNSQISLSDSLVDFANSLGDEKCDITFNNFIKTKNSTEPEYQIEKRRNGVLIKNNDLHPCNNILSVELDNNGLEKLGRKKSCEKKNYYEQKNFSNEKSNCLSSANNEPSNNTDDINKTPKFLRKLCNSFRRKRKTNNK